MFLILQLICYYFVQSTESRSDKIYAVAVDDKNYFEQKRQTICFEWIFYWTTIQMDARKRHTLMELKHAVELLIQDIDAIELLAQQIQWKRDGIIRIEFANACCTWDAMEMGIIFWILILACNGVMRTKQIDNRINWINWITFPFFCWLTAETTVKENLDSSKLY